MDRSTYRIGILLADGFALMSFASLVEPLRMANELAGRTLFALRTIPQQGAQAVSSGGAVIKASAQMGEQVDFDLVVVIAASETPRSVDPRLRSWLLNLDKRGVRLGGVSGGAAILARAGLMHRHRMTMHWEQASTLAEDMPDLNLVNDLYVVSKRRITCAGGTAPLDMVHALISEREGPDFARQVGERLLHTDVRPARGAQRSDIAERFGVSSPALVRSIETMEARIGVHLSLPQLAKLVGLGERQINRLFRSHLGESAMAFYRRMRLERGRAMLMSTSMPVTEIALATGFAGSAHFSQAFRAEFGETPTSLRKIV